MNKFRNGKIINKRYIIKSVIGKGGMGLVYKAYDEFLSSTVALKTLQSETLKNKKIQNAFLQEVKICQSLSHDNIVRVHDISKYDDIYFLTMAYVEGQNLKSWMKNNPEKDCSLFLGILKQICKALGYAHSKNIIHRDIKPGNIMISKNGKALLFDFGIAKPVGEDTILPGWTPKYAAPEQTSAGYNDHRSDIFSMGVMAYKMLTGKFPVLFSNDTTSTKTASQLNPKLNEVVDKIFSRVLAINPSDRYEDIMIFYSELEEALKPYKAASTKQIAHTIQITTDKESIVETLQDESPSRIINLKNMVKIQAGDFWMGSSGSKNDNAKPRHKVHLSTYYIDKYLVTNKEYRLFIKENNYPEPTLWSDPQFNKDDQPVVGVSWNDALEYAKWIGKRLPTEAEWERAAKGDDNRDYPWGDNDEDDRANVDDENDCTTIVGQYPKGISPFGCFDMIGNVWEWCFDWFDENYYKSSPFENPKSSKRRAKKVVRGGAFDSYLSFNATTAFRFFFDPSIKSMKVGFRCVADGNKVR